MSKLSRLMVKYPGGTPGRWEKVACDMGRSVKDVSLLLNIAKVKMWMACKTVFFPEKKQDVEKGQIAREVQYEV